MRLQRTYYSQRLDTGETDSDDADDAAGGASRNTANAKNKKGDKEPALAPDVALPGGLKLPARMAAGLFQYQVRLTLLRESVRNPYSRSWRVWNGCGDCTVKDVVAFLVMRWV